MRLTSTNPMNRALAGLLVCEAITFGLALPVLLLVAHAPVGLSVALTVAAMLAALAGAATMRRFPGIWLGWLAQGLGVAMGFLASAMFLVTAIFGAIWIAGVVLGRRMDPSYGRDR